MSAAQIRKSIELFLERNNLFETLHVFRNESSHYHNQKGRHTVSPQKPLICVNKKQVYQLQKIAHQTIEVNNPEVEAQLREYLQKTDIKLLKKVFDRIKKATAKYSVELKENRNQQNGLESMRFFRKLMQKEAEHNQLIREQIENRKNNINLMEESRQYENEWQNPHESGYDTNEFYTSELGQVCKELRAVRSPQFMSQVIKNSPHPEHYYLQIAGYKERINLNVHDKFYSKLPAHFKFGTPSEQEEIFEKKNFFSGKSQEQSNLLTYPIEMNNIVYDSYELKVIYDRDKTGFEEQRNIKIVINQVLAGKYQIISNLGQAQFSNAIEVMDLTNKQRYCLKIIQNNKEYFDQSLDQIKILKYLKANCNPDQKCLLNLHDYFYHKEHLMLMTELLKDTLLHAYTNNREMFTNLRNVQIITRQLLIGLEKLHELHIVHTDLKPENIMIKSYTNKTVKIIDLGSSVFFHDQPTFYVQTRNYRAPEVILGIPYDGKIDMWSLGCIVAEMFMGEILFEANSQASLLALIQGLRGPWPSWMLEKGRKVNEYFTKDMFIYEEMKDEHGEKTGKCRIYTPKLTNMKARVKCENKAFLDFLSKCLKIDPSQRISAKEALQHPFITETIYN